MPFVPPLSGRLSEQALGVLETRPYLTDIEGEFYQEENLSKRLNLRRPLRPTAPPSHMIGRALGEDVSRLPGQSTLRAP
jgi:hypothetical protein